METTPLRRALLSVSDKHGLVEFANGLRAFGVEILSTGGTARTLAAAGVPVTPVEEFTGFPEMLDGRVKTLHPRIHAGILHRRGDAAHERAMATHGLLPIDLIAVNLYPFEATVARPGVSWEEAIEEIDIGGPAMVRSAAKNHDGVAVVCSPEQYAEVLADLRAHGGRTSAALRRRLALEAFRRTAAYDAAIAGFFAGRLGAGAEGARAADPVPPEGEFPARLRLDLPRARLLRYGENPHQRAALYGGFLDRYRQLGGKDLSYNNLLDLAAAEEVAAALAPRGAAVAIIKHSNPCGAAVGRTVAEAWTRALATDPQSASGGIVAASRPLDRAAAEALGEHFIEILAAPGFAPDALEALRKKKNRILLEAAGPPAGRPVGEGLAAGLLLRGLPGGVLVQTPDERPLGSGDLRVVTRRAPSPAEMEALRFAWEVVRFVKSNAIVYAGPDRTLGIGAGQMSRVDAARIGVLKAREAGLDLQGAAVASDAFFPFPDGLLVAADAGATAAIQPGGSVRDAEVIAAADERGMAMVFTGVRHFRH
jgi:phosphoribosylaminoimidazolecarboxamide formyltransferase/IMP cyclohydrolase